MSAGRVRIRNWTAWSNPAGTVVGFIVVELGSGLIINNLRLMRGPKNRPWIGTPSIKRSDGSGYDDIIEFVSKPTRHKFEEYILFALRQQRPEAFDSFAEEAA